MPFSQLLVLFISECVLLLLPAPGLSRMFTMVGIQGWKAYVPFYNSWQMLTISKKSRYVFFCQFIPIVGWFVTIGIWTDFLRCFGRFRFYEQFLGAVFPYLYFPYVAYRTKVVFVGPEKAKTFKKSKAREWADAAVFAIIAATLIRTFIFEAYAIPTGSMEKTLVVGDYLFVNKLAYGPRLPNTPLAVPFIHNQLPFGRYRSYLEWIHVPYIRWFERPVFRGDVVVFNLPVGDTLVNLDEYDSKYLYYRLIREQGNGNSEEGRKIVQADPDSYPILTRPVDKRENYVKRCVAVAGDTLLIKDQKVYVNGSVVSAPPYSELYYRVTTYGQPLDESVLKEEYDVATDDPEQFQRGNEPDQFEMLLTESSKAKMLQAGLARSIVPDMDSVRKAGQVFPYDEYHRWTIDEFGPIWIPKKGATIELNKENIAIYARVIRTYEGNRLDIKDGNFYINGLRTDRYTFKMNYYWMMGDNRHDSQDSRLWGFVPEDHVIGRASFIWMSAKNGIRWNRLMHSIQ